MQASMKQARRHEQDLNNARQQGIADAVAARVGGQLILGTAPPLPQALRLPARLPFQVDK